MRAPKPHETHRTHRRRLPRASTKTGLFSTTGSSGTSGSAVLSSHVGYPWLSVITVATVGRALDQNHQSPQKIITRRHGKNFWIIFPRVPSHLVIHCRRHSGAPAIQLRYSHSVTFSSCVNVSNGVTLHYSIGVTLTHKTPQIPLLMIFRSYKSIPEIMIAPKSDPTC